MFGIADNLRDEMRTAHLRLGLDVYRPGSMILLEEARATMELASATLSRFPPRPTIGHAEVEAHGWGGGIRRHPEADRPTPRPRPGPPLPPPCRWVTK